MSTLPLPASAKTGSAHDRSRVGPQLPPLRPPRRVVTGHDALGQATIAIDDGCITFGSSPAQPDLRTYEMWEALGLPVALDNAPDPTGHPFRIAPPVGGTVVRIADIPPDTAELADPATIKRYFNGLNSLDASTALGRSEQPHPLMHRTETIDYGIMIEGRLTLVLDTSEVTLEPGDVVVQRGTNHAWSNRTDKMARIAFILMDGKFDEALTSA